MTTKQFYNELNYVNHTQASRLFYANLVLKQPDLLPKLLEITFMVNDKTSTRAAWVLEYVCLKNLELLLPYLDNFTLNIKKVHLDATVRPVVKICELLAKAYFGKADHLIKSNLHEPYKERIIETCFDVLINDEKVAPKAFAMSTLFLFGKQYDWIYPELTQILNRNFPNQSAAYKARAKQIIAKIKKSKN